MPSGPRVRANNVYGTIQDNPLLIGAISFTSVGLQLLPAISGQHAIVVLDPKREHGTDPEIVVVTSHLAMGTTATITRGQYGTVAREHPAGTTWAHVPIKGDFIEILTSTTRPSNPYEGQLIYETDTGVYKRWNGTLWLTFGTKVATSTTRPTDVFAGQLIYETDTNVYKTWNGTAWVTSGSLDDSGWISFSFLNSWVNYDTNTYGPAGYRKIGKIVYLRGLVKNGSSGTAAIANLPAGFRPGLGKTRVTGSSNELFCQYDIASTGDIIPVTGVSTLWTSLNNITFVADN